MSDKKWLKYMKKGAKDGIPIALGYLSVSFTFGLMAVSEGFAWWQATLISMTNLTSAGQFAGLSIMAAGGGLLEMMITQLVINLRYALMSLSLTQKVDRSIEGIYRWLVGFGNTDEIFAVAMSNEKPVGRAYMFGLIAVPYVGWAFGTLLGAVMGNVLPVSVCSALGITIYGMFLAIIVPVMEEDRRFLYIVLLAVFFSAAFHWVPGLNKVSSGFSIILSAITASIIGSVVFPIAQEEDDIEEYS